MERWRTIDVSSWEEQSDEPRGLRKKVWLRDPDDKLWLRKEPKKRPAALVTELFALRLAETAGLPVPESHACYRGSPEQQAILVRRFGTDSEPVDNGSLILRNFRPTHDINDRHSQTPELVRQAVLALEQGGGPRLLPDLVRILAFDAWVGMVDRHQGNWAVLSGTVTELAPMFDPAACLGSELLDEAASRWVRDPTSLSKYVAGCPSGFGIGGRAMLQVELVRAIRGWTEWSDSIDMWLAQFEVAGDTARRFMYAAESPIVSDRRHLIELLLEIRLEWLRKEAHA